jgi:hypothetical protein
MDMKKKAQKAHKVYIPTKRKLTPFGYIDYEELYNRIEQDEAYQFVKKHFMPLIQQEKNTEENDK